MCNKFCDQFETFNPEKEYIKFLRSKPVVDTSKLYESLHMPRRFKCPYLFEGYGVKLEENPMYRTVNSEYGYYAPNAFTIPTRFFPRPQKFSNEMIKSGMYRNFSLNTQMDSSFC